MFYAISYKISDDRRRLKVAKVLKDSGQRVQRSVFEANLEAGQVKRLKKRVGPLINPEEDSLRIYPLCAACVPRVEVLGTGVVAQDPEVIII